MPFDRFYLHEPFHLNEEKELHGDEFNHLSKVMRKKKGDVIELINGTGELAVASILEVTKNSGHLLITKIEKHEEQTPHVILIQAIPKLSHLEFILQKGTELGAHSFWLYPGTFSEKNDFSKNQISRFDHILVSAIKQCGRLHLPKIQIFPKLDDISIVEGMVFFGDLAPQAPFLKKMWDQTTKTLYFFNGPEQGFSEKEEALLISKFHAKGIKLNPNILRTETAAIAAITLFQLLQYGESLQ